MNANHRRSLVLALALALAFTPIAAGQGAPFRHELLALLPDDFGVCVVMHDLHGQSARWEKSAWYKAFRAASVGKHLFETPEFQHLEKAQRDLKKHLGLDWPALRDDILGDTVILAYSPGLKDQPTSEHGLFLLHVRKPARLLQLIDRLNSLQSKSGDLKSLTAVQYKGATYFRREEKAKTQYYFVDGSLAAVTSQESMMRALLDKRPGMSADHVWAKRFQRAGADQAFVTLCLNPSRIQPDVAANVKGSDAFPKYWRALEGIFVTLTIKDEAEVRISLQANTEQLPKWARSAFTRTVPSSALWSRFPEASVLTIAARLDFAGTVDGFIALLPEKDRKSLVAAVRNNIKAVLELDPFDDILPNVGPDWGVCVLPAKNANELPAVLAALAVKPGTKKPAVDKALLRAVHSFAGFAVLDHNAKHPDARLRLQTMMQDEIEVKYLASEKSFPPGVQPACALKDGYLVFASSPDAIRHFGATNVKTAATSETPLMKLSTPELAKLLDQRREHVQRRLGAKAERHLDNVISLLKLFDRITLSQRGDAGQASWTLRLTPAP